MRVESSSDRVRYLECREIPAVPPRNAQPGHRPAIDCRMFMCLTGTSDCSWVCIVSLLVVASTQEQFALPVEDL
jgi:hypothetical protein